VPRSVLRSDEIPDAQNHFAGENFPGFRNAEADRLIDEIEVELDRQKRAALWHRLETLYAEELPALPLYFRADAFVLPPWLEGVRPTGHQYPDDPLGRTVAPRGAVASDAMTRFILIRLLQMAAVLAVMSFVIYALIGLMPGDPIDLMIASNPHLTAADAARLKALYGLDRRWWSAYLAWAGAALHGDFGYSRLYMKGAFAVLLPRLGNTALLMGASFCLALALAVPLGIAGGAQAGSWLDGAVNLVAFAFISVPSFWLALMLIFIFAVSLGLLPAGGIATVGDGGAIDRIRHLVCCRWRRSRLASMGGHLRYVRAAMIETLGQDYIPHRARQGRQRGRRVLWRHALRKRSSR